MSEPVYRYACAVPEHGEACSVAVIPQRSASGTTVVAHHVYTSEDGSVRVTTLSGVSSFKRKDEDDA